ncbi:MAG TPA: TIM barrel protein [Sphingobium sp.]|uniref:sugar phosphate isomerase/epimerase family protein n=1 Tax=Sphingobium sp. TaxID=1912891 RepID=UPI002ED28B62
MERLCVFGMPPVAFVGLAADVGCSCVGIGLTGMRYYNPDGYPEWSLRDDPALRRELLAAMRDVGVGISLLEGFGIAPDVDVREKAGDLDILCELRGKRINAASIDRDLSRTFDGFAMLAEMADERGMEVVIEIGPGPIRTLSAALAAVHHVGRPNFRLLIDTMHYFRFGGSIAELAMLDPALIGYVQLCDAPLVSTHASYMEEALHERQVPGTGELPLLDLLRLVPPDGVVSVEVPQRSLAEAGMGPTERVAACVAATRHLLEQAGR